MKGTSARRREKVRGGGTVSRRTLSSQLVAEANEEEPMEGKASQEEVKESAKESGKEAEKMSPSKAIEYRIPTVVIIDCCRSVTAKEWSSDEDG